MDKFEKYKDARFDKALLSLTLHHPNQTLFLKSNYGYL